MFLCNGRGVSVGDDEKLWRWMEVTLAQSWDCPSGHGAVPLKVVKNSECYVMHIFPQ